MGKAELILNPSSVVHEMGDPECVPTWCPVLVYSPHLPPEMAVRIKIAPPPRLSNHKDHPFKRSVYLSPFRLTESESPCGA